MANRQIYKTFQDLPPEPAVLQIVWRAGRASERPEPVLEMERLRREELEDLVFELSRITNKLGLLGRVLESLTIQRTFPGDKYFIKIWSKPRD